MIGCIIKRRGVTMCDFDDDFEGFEDDWPDEEDQLGSEFDDEILEDLEGSDDDLADGAIENDAECDEFSGKDAFYIGGAMGWAYEEGLWEARRNQRRRKHKIQNKLGSIQREK